MTRREDFLATQVNIGPMGEHATTTLSPTMVFWNDRMQSFAMHGPVWTNDPDTEINIGDQFVQCPTFDSLIGSLAQRGLRLGDDQSMVNLIDLNAQVEERFGVTEVVGWTSPRCPRVGLLTPGGGWAELRPAVVHPSRWITWGDKSQNSLDTAQHILDRCVGPARGASTDAYHLMISVLADKGPQWSMTAQAVADWALDGETPTTTLSQQRVQTVKNNVLDLEQGRNPPPVRKGIERD